MSTVECPPLTVREYRLLPETGPRYQLIEGDLKMAPSPNRFHQDISGKLFLLLGNYLTKNPIGKLYSAPFDVVLDDTNVFQPDLTFISNDRAGVLTDAGVEGAPTLAIEILSPRTRKIDTDVKPGVLARSGVEELWIIDPGELRLEIFRLQENPKEAIASLSLGDSFESRCFQGLKIEVDDLFRR